MSAHHFWQGQLIDNNQLEDYVQNFQTHFQAPQDEYFPLPILLQACDNLSKQLARKDEVYHQLYMEVERSASTTKENILALLNTIGEFLRPENLEKKLKRELGTVSPFIPMRVNFEQHIYEAWAPLGTILHIAPANVFTVASLGLIEGLLAGNVNIIKASSRDSFFPVIFAKALCDADPTGKLKNYVVITHVSSSQTEIINTFYKHADAVSAWGSEESINKIRQNAPGHLRFIEWGHKISFSYFKKSHFENATSIENLAREVCTIEQQACSSPQMVYLDTDQFSDLQNFSKRLAQALEVISPKIERIIPSDAEQAELTTQSHLIHVESILGKSELVEAPNKEWRIFVSSNSAPESSPLYRTIWVKPLLQKNIKRTLRPIKNFLQTAGVAANHTEIAELGAALISSGVTRVNKIGAMLGGYAGEPHDGVYALVRFCQRISMDLNKDMDSIVSFNEITKTIAPVFPSDTPVLNKEEFQRRSLNRIKNERDGLFFRSGGSSGKPTLSTFTYEDYHTQMNTAARGLLAAGLNPTEDRVLNFFAAGNLYGGFISFFSILEHLECPQFPMGIVDDLKMVGEIIVSFNINAIVGPPGLIVTLFQENEEIFKERQIVRKVFYGGDHISVPQIEYLKSLGVATIRSAVYGSNDAGPMGYQCAHCQGSEHHIFSEIQHLEIFKLDCDEPAALGESGRLLFTSKNRAGQNITRYEIGDSGRFVLEPCPCGRTEPKIILEGRSSDVFKAGSLFLNYKYFLNIISDEFNYSGPVQLKLDDHQTGILLTVKMKEVSATIHEVKEKLIKHYHDLQAALEVRVQLELIVQYCEDHMFEVVKETGKLRHLVDCRSK